MKKLFTIKQEQFIRDNYKDMTYGDIANYLGSNFTERQVRGWANNHGLTKNDKINDDYFNVIDNATKAYFLGFIYADGWIIDNEERRNYEFGMQIQLQDGYILDILKSELDTSHDVVITPERETVINGVCTISHEMALLRIYSKGLIKGLESNGIVQNKTNSEIFPVVDNYFFDYLRGYIDGDGCYYRSTKTGKIQISITCSNMSNLQYIKAELLKYSIICSIYTEKSKKHRLLVSSEQCVIDLINYMFYDNCICLKRKYEKIKDYLGLKSQ